MYIIIAIIFQFSNNFLFVKLFVNIATNDIDRFVCRERGDILNFASTYGGILIKIFMTDRVSIEINFHRCYLAYDTPDESLI